MDCQQYFFVCVYLLYCSATARFEYSESAISLFCQSDPSNFEHARMNYVDFFGTRKWIQWNSYIQWFHENEKSLSICENSFGLVLNGCISSLHFPSPQLLWCEKCPRPGACRPKSTEINCNWVKKTFCLSQSYYTFPSDHFFFIDGYSLLYQIIFFCKWS